VKKNIIIVGILVILILFLDQLLKIYIKTEFLPGEVRPLLGKWLVLDYIENPGMAFGTTFGSAIWHKLALSIFRIFAIGAICYYWHQQAKKGAKIEFLIAVGLILAGATGNLIDSMFYDFIFKYDPCMGFNHSPGSGIKTDCGFFGTIETRHKGFLLGNVVDMFKFQASWPQWVPVVGGGEVFPAIWNVADFSISTGIILIFIRQRVYFPKDIKKNTEEITPETTNVTEDRKDEE
jgi:signal peptidase II